MAASSGRFRLCGLVRNLSRLQEEQQQREVPHRRHPGISHLKTVRLPEALSQGARLLLEQSPIRRVEESARELSDFLWSRKRAVEDRELQTRARHLWERLAGSAEGNPS
ncbi:ribosome assembly protein METTL17, mitochondrial-like, partial [Mustelus asterias]